MEEEQFRTSVQELFQSIRFVLSLDSRNSETLIFTQVRKPAATKTFFLPCLGSREIRKIVYVETVVSS